MVGACNCPGCQAHIKRRWKGYIGVALPGSGKKAVAEVTAESVRGIPAIFHEDGSIRGKTLKLTRAGKHPNSALACELVITAAPFFLPKEFDVLDALYRLWGIDPLFPRGDPGDVYLPDDYHQARAEGGG
jgi:hypothetical protein